MSLAQCNLTELSERGSQMYTIQSLSGTIQGMCAKGNGSLFSWLACRCIWLLEVRFPGLLNYPQACKVLGSEFLSGSRTRVAAHCCRLKGKFKEETRERHKWCSLVILLQCMNLYQQSWNISRYQGVRRWENMFIFLYSVTCLSCCHQKDPAKIRKIFKYQMGLARREFKASSWFRLFEL